VAAVALRAADLESGRARPANVTVHFLGVANFDDPVTVTVVPQRVARQASSLSVRMEQNDRPIIAAMVWAVDDGLDGLVHDDAPAPEVVHWSDCPTMDERFAAMDVTDAPRHRFWENFDQRPPNWIDDWATREPGRPLYQNWVRFRFGGPAADPWTQAARLLLMVDFAGWPAVSQAHVGDQWIAPSIDVSCEFHRLTAPEGTTDEWLLVQAESPDARDGLAATRQQVWNDRGQLLASGISHLLCRRLS
jgi:acyl-CoA thioesterase